MMIEGMFVFFFRPKENFNRKKCTAMMKIVSLFIPWEFRLSYFVESSREFALFLHRHHWHESVDWN